MSAFNEAYKTDFSASEIPTDLIGAMTIITFEIPGPPEPVAFNLDDGRAYTCNGTGEGNFEIAQFRPTVTIAGYDGVTEDDGVYWHAIS